jgi:hypothetical protein
MYTRIDNIKIHYDFNDGIKVNIDGPDNLYYVELREYPKKSQISKLIQGYHITSKDIYGQKKMFQLDIKFYMDFEILIYRYDSDIGLSLIWSHRYNDRGKLVNFEITSNDEDEAKFWMSKVLQYSKTKGCKPIIKSKFDNLNKLTPNFFNIHGVEPYKTYKIGRLPKSSTDWKTVDDRFQGVINFGNWKSIWSYEHPRSWNELNSSQIVDDILGL